MWYVCLWVVCLGCMSCGKDDLTFEKNDLKISVETGENWLHDFPLFLGLKTKNPPQFVIWITDLDTNYIGTVFCTRKIAREGWIMNKGNRRKEALPFWAYNRGIQEADGLYLPTKENPLMDAVTGATPKENCTMRMQPHGISHFLLFAEFNHSTDFNDAYPKNAGEGTWGYSGGKEGGGQPALIYWAEIDLSSSEEQWIFKLIGHSSPDGTDGNLYENMEGIDSALSIVKRIVVTKIR